MILTSALMCLALNVFFESRGEQIPGQYAVAMVTMNRAGGNPKNVCREVLKPKQFSWTDLYVHHGKGSFSVKRQYVMKEEPAWELAKRIAQTVLSGRIYDITGGATYYHAKSVHPFWRKGVEYRKTIGNHIFYAAM